MTVYDVKDQLVALRHWALKGIEEGIGRVGAVARGAVDCCYDSFDYIAERKRRIATFAAIGGTLFYGSIRLAEYSELPEPETPAVLVELADLTDAINSREQFIERQTVDLETLALQRDSPVSELFEEELETYDGLTAEIDEFRLKKTQIESTTNVDSLSAYHAQQLEKVQDRFNNVSLPIFVLGIGIFTVTFLGSMFAYLANSANKYRSSQPAQ